MTSRQLASLRKPRVQAVSRRAFVATAAGALAAGAAVTNGVWRPLAAHELDAANPVPIPVGSFGFHVNAPGLPGLDPVDADPSTITDFHGFTALAYISGMVVRTNRKSHEKVELPFLVSDMRFMDGEYRGFDGRIRRGTFGLIWIDVYTDASMAVQIDDMNPGIEPNGLFWTTAIDDDNIDVDFGRGRAEMRVRAVKIEDFGTFNNSLFGGPSVPTTASFEVHWAGRAPRAHIVNAAGEMDGDFIRNAATMEWSATTPDFTFVSRPASTSSSVFAEIGHERNGVFFHHRP